MLILASTEPADCAATTNRPLILTLSCDAKPGIIAAVTGELARRDANITETAQFWDRDSDRFFLRIAFLPGAGEIPRDVRAALAPAAARFGMDDLAINDATGLRRSSSWSRASTTPSSTSSTRCGSAGYAPRSPLSSRTTRTPGDEGPIIEQEIERVTHAMNAEDLVAVGRDVESRVLARAVKFHLESRVMINGHRTVVFA